MKFTYSIVRYVPDTARGEFVNVGVLIHNVKGRIWQLKLVPDWSRAEQFGTPGSLAALKSVLDDVNSTVRTDLYLEPPSESWMSSLHSDFRNVIQFTEPTPMMAESVESALELIWKTFIYQGTNYRRQLGPRSRLKRDITAWLNRKHLVSRDPGELRKKLVHDFVLDEESNIVADYVGQNGSWHVFETLDFRVKSETLRLRHTEALSKAWTLEKSSGFLRDRATLDVKRFVIHAGANSNPEPGKQKIVHQCLKILDGSADEVLDYEDPDGRQRAERAMTSAIAQSIT